MESSNIRAPFVPDLGSIEGLRPVGTTASEPLRASNAAPSAKIDLRGMEPPKILSQARIEDLTIDGICGVY